jgi:hypothetical protein
MNKNDSPKIYMLQDKLTKLFVFDEVEHGFSWTSSNYCAKLYSYENALNTMLTNKNLKLRIK